MNPTVPVQPDPDYFCFPYYNMRDSRRKGSPESDLLFYIKIDSVFDSQKQKADELKSNITEWINGIISAYPQESVIITTVPKHTERELHQFLVDFCTSTKASYYELLQRTKTVPPGAHNQKVHKESIQVTFPGSPEYLKGKVIFVLDDIWTTGSTMRACKEKLQEALALHPGVTAEIKLLAIGRTQWLSSV